MKKQPELRNDITNRQIIIIEPKERKKAEAFHLTATEGLKEIEAGRLTAVNWMESCLQRISDREGDGLPKHIDSGCTGESIQLINPGKNASCGRPWCQRHNRYI